ncbi:LysR family transcriptional regulator [Paenibacillus sp.]|uniref:LysR family transcriptional regulator n=1 Tax=Paenibacillus sp. TaxID=58172 RepID=UPI002811F77B|nr:LysR family transcriptional regulator [Paenibacillus sp.]
MDLRQLAYFVAVAKAQSYTKAAERLHVTQPTLSKMVRLLEEELNVTLFERGGSKRIRLTDAGEILLRSAQGILTSVENMTTELDDLLELRRGDLLLGLPPMIGGRYFPPILEHFRAKYPHINIKLIEKGGKRIETAVEAGDLDVGIVILPVENEAAFTIRPFFEDELRAVLHAEHPLASRTSIALRELAAEPFILFGEQFTLHHLILQACAEEGFRPEIALETAQWDFMTGMVAARFGVAFLPQNVCDKIDDPDVRTVPLASPEPKWRLAMIWRKERYLPYAARAWIELLKGWTFS